MSASQPPGAPHPAPGAPSIQPPPVGKVSRCDSGTITSIAESPLRAGLLYAGTEGGSVWRTGDDGRSWRRVRRM